MTSASKRKEVVSVIDEAVTNGAKQSLACAIIGVDPRTHRRWKQSGEDSRPSAHHPSPGHKLSEEERSEILAVCHSSEFASSPPSQIVPTLADKGVFIASESSFYRVLNDAKEKNHRGRAATPRKLAPPSSFTAYRPNQIWTWDVTWLKGPAKGIFFYLYMIIDIYSRKIVGWEVWDEETSEHASELIQRAMLKEQCNGLLEAYHADNGSIQRSETLRVKLDELGVQASYSRPRVSNDNPFSESEFRTLKYRPDFPVKGFEAVADARRWVFQFVSWYNTEHRHSGINFVTPQERHSGKEDQVLTYRKEIYEAAKVKNPSRWSRSIRCWEPVGDVHLNRPSIAKTTKRAA